MKSLLAYWTWQSYAQPRRYVNTFSAIFWICINGYYMMFNPPLLLCIWDKVFKSGPSKICGRQPLKNLKGYGLLKQYMWLLLSSFQYCITNFSNHFFKKKKKCSENFLLYQAQPWKWWPSKAGQKIKGYVELIVIIFWIKAFLKTFFHRSLISWLLDYKIFKTMSFKKGF